jgi:site-specific recombinase XerD
LKLNNTSSQIVLLKEYLDVIKNLKNYSDHTVVAYKTDISQYFKYINNNKSINPEKFVQSLAKMDYSKTTLNRKIASITAFLNWCSKTKGVDTPDISNIKALKTEKSFLML